jgi:hypothetical protein
MTGGIEAAGDLASGALWARTVEPRAGEVQREHGRLCLNCGTALVGDYCHECGQAGHVHRSLAAIGHDLAHGVLHFEGKIWCTLPMLLFRPGALTRRYIAGERARFVSPLALFLFLVFIMFATIHALAGEVEPDMSTAVQEKSIHRIDEEIAQARKSAAAASTADARTQYEESIEGLTTARRAMASGDDYFGLTNVETGVPWLDHGIAKANANPSLAFYKLQMSAYKFSWALIPISVPFVALLFLWRRRYKLYDHAIFVIYSLDFMTLLVIALSVLGAVGLGSSWIALAIFLLPPFHMYKQLRGAYALRRFSAAWRTIALLVFAFVALFCFVALMLGMGLMG